MRSIFFCFVQLLASPMAVQWATQDIFELGYEWSTVHTVFDDVVFIAVFVLPLPCVCACIQQQQQGEENSLANSFCNKHQVKTIQSVPTSQSVFLVRLFHSVFCCLSSYQDKTKILCIETDIAFEYVCPFAQRYKTVSVFVSKHHRNSVILCVLYAPSYRSWISWVYFVHRNPSSRTQRKEEKEEENRLISNQQKISTKPFLPFTTSLAAVRKQDKTHT